MYTPNNDIKTFKQAAFVLIVALTILGIAYPGIMALDKERRQKMTKFCQDRGYHVSSIEYPSVFEDKPFMKLKSNSIYKAECFREGQRVVVWFKFSAWSGDEAQEEYPTGIYTHMTYRID